MILTPTTEKAAKTAAQLDAAIRRRLTHDTETLALFDAFASLMDSLAGGTSGERLLVEYDELVAGDLAKAQAALDRANRPNAAKVTGGDG